MQIRIETKSAEAYSIRQGKSANCLAYGVGWAGDFCLQSKIFSILTLGHLHTFIHELGHAASYELLSGGKATINLSTKSCYGSTTFEQPKRQLPGAAHTYTHSN